MAGNKLSDHLGIPKEEFEKLGIFDPFIGIDTNLFLDPALLRNTEIPEFKDSYVKITNHFNDVIRLILASKQRGDVFWKEAYKRLIFKETQGTSIGYGSNTSDGNAIGPKLALKITDTASQIIQMGIKDPALFELVCLFEEELGADRLSDMAISIIKTDILVYTDKMVEELKLKADQVQFSRNITGKKYRLIKGPLNNKPILLLPKNLLKDLPLALTRDDIGYISYFNESLRRKISALIFEDTVTNIKDITKAQYRETFFNKKDLSEAIVAYKNKEAEKYDYDKDPSGEVSWYEKGKEYAKKFPLEIDIKRPKELEQVSDIVHKIINQFKRSVESNELYELLYKDPVSELKPRNERYAQRLFYSIADTYCKANNVVLSREPNAGNGPVDFKVSGDYKTQVLVEIKLSSGKVRNGFEKQLPEYEKNENASSSFLVIMLVTKTYKQVEDVERMVEDAKKLNKHVPELVIIDALPRVSASKKPKDSNKA